MPWFVVYAPRPSLSSFCDPFCSVDPSLLLWPAFAWILSGNIIAASNKDTVAKMRKRIKKEWLVGSSETAGFRFALSTYRKSFMIWTSEQSIEQEVIMDSVCLPIQWRDLFTLQCRMCHCASRKVCIQIWGVDCIQMRMLFWVLRPEQWNFRKISPS